MSTPRPWQRDAALADAASAEVASREKHYPAMIDAGEITRPLAAEDLDAWRAIAVLFDQGVVDAGLTWSDLVAAAARALVTRRAACDAKPADLRLAGRLATVGMLHRQLARGRRAALDIALPVDPAATPFPFAAEVPRRSPNGISGTRRMI